MYSFGVRGYGVVEGVACRLCGVVEGVACRLCVWVLAVGFEVSGSWVWGLDFASEPAVQNQGASLVCGCRV